MNGQGCDLPRVRLRVGLNGPSRACNADPQGVGADPAGAARCPPAGIVISRIETRIPIVIARRLRAETDCFAPKPRARRLRRLPTRGDPHFTN